jgi:HAD superfamily hydrolase (TIGR01493 family)
LVPSPFVRFVQVDVASLRAAKVFSEDSTMKTMSGVFTKIKCVAFDCFGTVFDMSGVSRDEIAAYVSHVRGETFSPFPFPKSWWSIRAHQDSAEGIARLRKLGIRVVTLSNGDSSLIRNVSEASGIVWDDIIDLAERKVYKPHLDAYRAVESVTGLSPAETLMVTANPTFGDIEGAAAVGMNSQVIRHGYPDTIIDLARIFGG